MPSEDFLIRVAGYQDPIIRKECEGCGHRKGRGVQYGRTCPPIPDADPITCGDGKKIAAMADAKVC